MKKVGILTFYWADDFGAMLQAYALKKNIADLGCSVQIIPYSRKEFVGRYWIWPYYSLSGNSCSFIGKSQLRVYIYHLKHLKFYLTKRKRMRLFRKNFLSTEKSTSNTDKLNFSDYDCIIIGSDQVWNPELTVGIDKIYWGNFKRNETAKIISYAASIGTDNFSSSEKEQIATYIENFDTVTVREHASIPLLKELTSKNIEEMPDPTLLCEKETWIKLISASKASSHKEKYIVLHSTERNLQMINYAKKLQNETGFDIIDIREDEPNGPLEFLDTLAHAEYVVTNSFHGTVFSIIFEKQFVTFSHTRKNTRLKDFLDNSGLSDRLSPEHETETMYSPIDWKSVNSSIKELKEKGISFLQKAID